MRNWRRAHPDWQTGERCSVLALLGFNLVVDLDELSDRHVASSDAHNESAVLIANLDSSGAELINALVVADELKARALKSREGVKHLCKCFVNWIALHRFIESEHRAHILESCNFVILDTYLL